MNAKSKQIIAVVGLIVLGLIVVMIIPDPPAEQKRASQDLDKGTRITEQPIIASNNDDPIVPVYIEYTMNEQDEYSLKFFALKKAHDEWEEMAKSHGRLKALEMISLMESKGETLTKEKKEECHKVLIDLYTNGWRNANYVFYKVWGIARSKKSLLSTEAIVYFSMKDFKKNTKFGDIAEFSKKTLDEQSEILVERVIKNQEILNK